MFRHVVDEATRAKRDEANRPRAVAPVTVLMQTNQRIVSFWLGTREQREPATPSFFEPLVPQAVRPEGVLKHGAPSGLASAKVGNVDSVETRRMKSDFQRRCRECVPVPLTPLS